MSAPAGNKHPQKTSMAPTRGASKPAGSNSKSAVKKPYARKQTTATAGEPAPKQKRKFVPKTHTTAGVAVGSKKDPKMKKKRRLADLAKLEKELPKLNMITPAGVVKPKGRKKGKVFVEDKDRMMTILSRVNDSKDGQIQSKLERSRQLEVIREARRKEEDARYEQRKSKMETAKDAVRNKRKRKNDDKGETEGTEAPSKFSKKSSSRKKVSFA